MEQQIQDLVEQANIRISVLEKQRNDSQNQTLNALVELRIVTDELEKTRQRANVLAEKCLELTDELNRQAEELERLYAVQPKKRKTNG